MTLFIAALALTALFGLMVYVNEKSTKPEAQPDESERRRPTFAEIMEQTALATLDKPTICLLFAPWLIFAGLIGYSVYLLAH